MRSFIDVGIDGDNLVALADDGSIYRQSLDGWEQLPGFSNTGSVARRPIAASHHGPADDLVLLVQDVVVGGSTALFRLEGDSWVSMGSPPNCAAEKRARRVAGVSCYLDSVAAVCDDGSIWQFTAGAWAEIAGPPSK